MHQKNIEKAKVIYDFLDSSKMFTGTVEKKDRSLMNIPFVNLPKYLIAVLLYNQLNKNPNPKPLVFWQIHRCGNKQIHYKTACKSVVCSIDAKKVSIIY